MVFIYLAVELSNEEIKLALIKKTRKGNQISNYEKYSLPKDKLDEALSDYLEKISKNNLKVKTAVLILKETKIYKKFEYFPKMNDKDIKNLIQNNSEDFFPVNLDDYIVDYKILIETKSEIFLMIVSIKKSIIEEYMEIFSKNSLEVSVIDFYQNIIGEMFGKIFKDKTFIISTLNEKFSFIYLMEGHIINIREIEIKSESDILREITSSFGFYKNEIFDIKNLVFVDDIKILKDFFEGYRVNIYSDTSDFFKIESEKLSFLGIKPV